MHPQRIETHLAYEWRKAQMFERQANGDRNVAFDNLVLVLSVTVNPVERSVLINTGMWMKKHWGVGQEPGLMEEKKEA